MVADKERKEFRWRQLPEGLYKISFVGGGEIPKELDGSWTSLVKLQSAIENYKVKRGD